MQDIDERALKRYLLDVKPRKGEKVYNKKSIKQSDQCREIGNYQEYEMVKMLDLQKEYHKILPILKRLDSGHLDVSGLFGEVSNSAALQLLNIALNGESEKNRLDAVKHLLALGGHSPAQKHEISRVDPNTPKEAILSLIAGMKGDLEREGLEVVDDRIGEEADKVK